MNCPVRHIAIMLLFFALSVAQSGLSGPPVQAQEPIATEKRNIRAEPEKPPAHTIFRTISAVEAAQMMDSRDDIQIIDVRTPQERRQFRIADTRLVPVGDVIRGVFKPELSQPIILVCAVGGRSYVAGKVMSARGYQEIYNMEGGIESWRRAGLPLETGPEERVD